MYLKPNTEVLFDTNCEDKYKQYVIQKHHTSVNVQEALQVSQQLLPMLNSSRATDRDDWMTVGWVLYNIGKGSEEALNQWLKFSEQCEEKYVGGSKGLF